MKIICKMTLCLLLCVTMLCGTVVGFTSCAERSPILMTVDGQSMSMAQYNFLLSRAKAAYERSGVTLSDWNAPIDMDGKTWNDAVHELVLAEAKLMLAGVALFEAEGLSLPEATMNKINTDINEYIEYHADGSKSQFNSILSTYGFNADMLKEHYIFEAKYEYIQAYTYGEDGAKIAATAKQQYLDTFGICFKQVLFRNDVPVYEKDTNGDEVYYLVDTNNGKVNNIAYDAAHGVTRTDKDGKVIKDEQGETVYFLPDGKIAYDKENGVRVQAMVQGNLLTEKLSTEEVNQNKAAANAIVDSVASKDYPAFESAISEYINSDDDKYWGEDELCFLYTENNSEASLDTLAVELAEMAVGDVRMIPTENGYHVVMKYALPEDAVSNSAYAEWFSDLPARVEQYLFANKCKPLVDAIVVDEEILATAPKMVEVAANYRY